MNITLEAEKAIKRQNKIGCNKYEMNIAVVDARGKLNAYC
jgi:hypothetical protein